MTFVKLNYPLISVSSLFRCDQYYFFCSWCFQSIPWGCRKIEWRTFVWCINICTYRIPWTVISIFNVVWRVCILITWYWSRFCSSWLNWTRLNSAWASASLLTLRHSADQCNSLFQFFICKLQVFIVYWIIAS